MVHFTSGTVLTPLHHVDEFNRWDNRPFTGIWPECGHDKSTDLKKTIKKKPKRIRTAYTTDQVRALEMIFTQNKYITSDRRREISELLNIGDKSVKIWFQNRRMKEKKEFTESSSDTSNETIVCEMSPPPVPLTVPHISDPATHSVNQDVKPCLNPDSYQYQGPNFSINNEQIHASHAPDIMPTNGMQFYNNTNVYPAQYYPYNGDNYLNNYYHYQQENAGCNNYWNSNDVESSGYFYN